MYNTASTTHPGFLFPALKATTSSEQRWITVKPQSFSTDQPRSHDKRPSSQTLPEVPDTILVTHVHDEVSKSRTTVSSPNHEQLSVPTLQTRGVLDQVLDAKAGIISVTSAPKGESDTIYVTTKTSVSAKDVNEPTQPLFNGKTKNLTVRNKFQWCMKCTVGNNNYT